MEASATGAWLVITREKSPSVYQSSLRGGCRSIRRQSRTAVRLPILPDIANASRRAKGPVLAVSALGRRAKAILAVGHFAETAAELEVVKRPVPDRKV